jgi:hypothetical protein
MLSILLFNLIKFSGSIQVVNATRSFTPSEEENKREGKDKKKKGEQILAK